MKSLHFMIVPMLAAVLLFSSCGSQKKTTHPNAPILTDTTEQANFLKTVRNSSQITSRYVTSKLKFVVEMGPQKINLTGNLRREAAGIKTADFFNTVAAFQQAFPKFIFARTNRGNGTYASDNYAITQNE